MADVAPTAPINPPTPITPTSDLAFAGLDAEGRTEIHVKGDQKYVPYDRFKAVNEAAKAAKEQALLEVQAAKKSAEEYRLAAEKARSDVVDWQFRAALQSRGITDPEDIAEFKDRYQRAPTGDDGNKPTPYEWANKIATTPPKWAQGYFGTPPVVPAAQPPATPQTPTAAPAVPPAAAPRVNGGTQTAPVPAGRLTDAQIAAMSPAELVQHSREILGNQHVRNPELRKKLGLDG